MFSHRLFAALTGFFLVAATFAFSAPDASAQDNTSDVQAVLAAIGPDSVATGQPVTVVLAGATSRHTLEIAGAIAAAVGTHGHPTGWVVVHAADDFDAAGSVITISDGPGTTAQIMAERGGQRSTIALTGNAGELVVMANELAGRSGPASIDVAVPDTWMPDMLAEALGLISELALGGDGSMRLVTDLGVDHTRELVVVGPAGVDRPGNRRTTSRRRSR